MTHQLKGIL